MTQHCELSKTIAILLGPLEWLERTPLDARKRHNAPSKGRDDSHVKPTRQGRRTIKTGRNQYQGSMGVIIPWRVIAKTIREEEQRRHDGSEPRLLTLLTVASIRCHRGVETQENSERGNPKSVNRPSAPVVYTGTAKAW